VRRTWEIFFILFKYYVEGKGTTIIPKGYVTEEGYRLGEWVSYQRRLYKINKLSPDRRVQLEQLKGWVWDKSEALWQEGYKHIREYSEREGHTEVPIKYVTNGGYMLGEWVANQRRLYKDNNLSPYRRIQLEQLKGWVWDKSEALWQEGYKHIREYSEREGHTSVPIKYVTNDGYVIGRWVAYQRRLYKINKLSPDRRVQLERLKGWVWDTSEALWQECYKHICEYSERKGHTEDLTNYVMNNDYNLGLWVRSQCQAYLKGKLSRVRQQALESLPGWTWPDETNLKLTTEWSDGFFELLRDYIKSKGHSRVPVEYTKNGYWLGRWVVKIRRAYRLNRLSQEQQRALGKLDGWEWQVVVKNNNSGQSNPHNYDRWIKGYEYLLEYINDNHNSVVPIKYVTDNGFRLGTWVLNQRALYKQGRLKADRRKKLDRIAEWFWSRKEAKQLINRNDHRESFLICTNNNRNHFKSDYWQIGLKKLDDFVQKEGHTRIPNKYVTKDGFKLGIWTRNQRDSFSRGELNEKRQRILEKISGWYWNQNNARWLKGLEYLLRYIKRNGNTLVQRNYIEEDGYKLGQWVMSQREKYKHKILTAKRRKILEGLPLWTWSVRRKIILEGLQDRNLEMEHAYIWGKTFERLKLYVKEKSTSRIHQYYKTEDGYGLGGWVHRQRQIYKKGGLSSKQIELFEQLPDWVWDGREAHWPRSFKLLQKYAQETGHVNVPFNYKTENGYNLGVWVAKNKTLYRQGKLSKERQIALEQMLGWTWGVSRSKFPTITWSEAYEYLKNYLNLYHSMITGSYVTDHGYHLGRWVNNQRSFYKKGKLSSKRIELLEILPDWIWNGREANWRKSLKLSQKYSKDKGHANISSNSIDWSKAYEYLKQYSKVHHLALMTINYVTHHGYPLGKWVSHQRNLYRKGKLLLQHQKALEKLPSWSWGKPTISWSKAYEYLKQYSEVHHHSLVPSNYFTDHGYNLGKWVRCQRNLYKNGILSLERQNSLEQILNWSWDIRENQPK